MDPKKSLKPELKDIYERVMSTKTAPRSPVPAGNTNNPTSTASSAKPEPVKPQPVSPPPSPAASQPDQAPYLTGSAPRPITNSDAFVFSTQGKNSAKFPKKENKKPEKESKHEASPSTSTEKKSEKSKKLYSLLVGCMVIFLIVWTIFWALFLDII